MQKMCQLSVRSSVNPRGPQITGRTEGRRGPDMGDLWALPSTCDEAGPASSTCQAVFQPLGLRYRVQQARVKSL